MTALSYISECYRLYAGAVPNPLFLPGKWCPWSADRWSDGRDGMTYIEKLCKTLCGELVQYIGYSLPNGSETWDDKIEMLNKVADILEFVTGNELYFHSQAAKIFRYIATSM